MPHSSFIAGSGADTTEVTVVLAPVVFYFIFFGVGHKLQDFALVKMMHCLPNFGSR